MNEQLTKKNTNEQNTYEKKIESYQFFFLIFKVILKYKLRYIENFCLSDWGKKLKRIIKPDRNVIESSWKKIDDKDDKLVQCASLTVTQIHE